MPIKTIVDFGPKSKDCFRLMKEKYPNYDVVIMNHINSIFIQVIHPDLVQ